MVEHQADTYWSSRKRTTNLSKQQYMKSRAVMLSVLDDGRKVTPFVILKRKSLLKLKKTCGIVFKQIE
jgi:hypothetical protein